MYMSVHSTEADDHNPGPAAPCGASADVTKMSGKVLCVITLRFPRREHGVGYVRVLDEPHTAHHRSGGSDCQQCARPTPHQIPLDVDDSPLCCDGLHRRLC